MGERDETEFREEYDFWGATRGKHIGRYRESPNVVVLDPDVADRFPTPESVNSALRSLDPDLSTTRDGADTNHGGRLSVMVRLDALGSTCQTHATLRPRSIMAIEPRGDDEHH